MEENVTLMKNVSNATVSESKNVYFGVNKAAYQGVLSGLCVLAAFTIISNVVVLIASKFTTAGQSATLVFIRSLCIADVVTGLFGIFKAILLNHLDSIMINCFLAESLFASASTTLSLTLLWLNCDSYLRLTRPLSYGNSMDKSNIINSMMFLWNFAFILGFMPQMGWSRDQYTCNQFEYYDDAYLRLICSIWMLCMIISCILQYKLQKVRQQVLENSHLLSPDSQAFKKYSKLIITIRIDVIIWILCYLPLLIYLLLYCNSCSLGGTKMANINLFFFIPIFLIRSFISAFIHSYRTIKIQQAMRNISRRLSSAILHKGSLSSVEGASSNGSSKSNQSDPIINTVSKTASKLGVRAHQCLEATSSNVTIDSTLEETVVGHDCANHESLKGSNSMIKVESYPLKETLPAELIRPHKCIVHETPRGHNSNTAKQTIYAVMETSSTDLTIKKSHKCPVHDNSTGHNLTTTASEEPLAANMKLDKVKNSTLRKHSCENYVTTLHERNYLTTTVINEPLDAYLKLDMEKDSTMDEHSRGNNFTTAEVVPYPMKETLSTDLNINHQQWDNRNIVSNTSAHHSQQSHKTLTEVKEHIPSDTLVPNPTAVTKVPTKLGARTHKRLERSQRLVEQIHKPLELTPSLVTSDSMRASKPTGLEFREKQEENDNAEVFTTNLWYRKTPKISDTPKLCCNHLKSWTRWLFLRVMHPKDAEGTANNVDPDQTALGLHCLPRPVCPKT